MVVGFDVATIIDLVGRIGRVVGRIGRVVGRIGRVVANFHGQDYVHFDAYLAQMLPNADTGLRRSLTLAVLAGAQEAARFGVKMIASAGGQLPAEPALDFARNQLGRLSFAFGAFVCRRRGWSNYKPSGRRCLRHPADGRRRRHELTTFGCRRGRGSPGAWFH